MWQVNCPDQSYDALDADHDGFFLPGGCGQPQDCEDNNAQVYPGAVEVCNQLDDNCDGAVDETGGAFHYLDEDHDGYGDPGQMSSACQAPPGYVDNPGDCDDQNADIYEGAVEVCDLVDNNCDGLETSYTDVDGDGWGSSECGGEDCSDDNSEIFPYAEEICDGLDQDCDGQTDEGTLAVYYADTDADGYADFDQPSEPSCEPPGGYIIAGDVGDCNDTNAQIHPDSPELCNRRDDNCDGVVDDGFDIDLDGFSTCTYATGDVDCDDYQWSVYPGAIELCNNLDDNCDGQIDEGYDQDEDSFTMCAQGDRPPDCDDSDPLIFPGAPEECDGIDNDCNNTGDDGFDQDGDGYLTCQVGSRAADCNDGDAQIHPDAVELCNRVDDNCSGAIDEGFDHDGDGFTSCGTSSTPADCNDGMDVIYPGATDTCNEIDDDCDDVVDEGCRRVSSGPSR